MTQRQGQLIWLEPGDPFPSVQWAWGADSSAPGLLAAGGDLSPNTLVQAYRHGIFPWYSPGQPALWWSPPERMVLPVSGFRLRRSLRQTMTRFLQNPACEMRFDHDFEAVIRACSQAPRAGQSGTWITEEMIQAYLRLHQLGLAHSVETWIDGELQAGLYAIQIGQAVFGESMFTRVPDGSKLALATLVDWCLQVGVEFIDCQQNTHHLASLGAREIARTDFNTWLNRVTDRPAPAWKLNSVYWKHVSRLR